MDYRRDSKGIKKYSVSEYEEIAVNRMRAQDKNLTYVWRLHSENVPCKVVSIRQYMAHIGREDPLFGHRLVIQALVKFDTSQVRLCVFHLSARSKVLQSLQVYDKKGKLLAGNKEPKRVVEYLIMQKKGWINSPWVIREQLHESLDSRFREHGE